jgi:hypothetical protein
MVDFSCLFSAFSSLPWADVELTEVGRSPREASRRPARVKELSKIESRMGRDSWIRRQCRLVDRNLPPETVSVSVTSLAPVGRAFAMTMRPIT